MTIVAAAAAPDGIVLAADSRTTFLQGRRHRVRTDHARKLFAPRPGIGLATFGAAMIGMRTIAGIVDELASSEHSGKPEGVDAFAEALAAHFGARIDDFAEERGRTPPPGALGFLVAGYAPDGIGSVREVLLPSSDNRGPVLDHQLSTREPGTLYRGRTGFLRRMMEGYDVDGLRREGTKIPDDVERDLRGSGYPITPPISLQDAVDSAAFAVRATIDLERLTDGTVSHPGSVPACGGRLQALAVTHSETTWIAAPQLRVSGSGLAEDG